MRPLPHFLLWLAGARRAETQTTDRERAALSAQAAGRATLVEIGVWHGVTTAVLRTAMAPTGVLWAVDPFPPGQLGFSLQRPIALSEVRRVPNGRVRWIRTTGVEAAAVFRQEGSPPVDLIFIDGDHSYDGLVSDWRAWSPLVARGGVVCLHDSRSTPDRPIDDAGSVRATSEVVRTDPAFEVVDEIDSLTVVRKRTTPVPPPSR
jgi:predicted O-methyltransferase YrrM